MSNPWTAERRERQSSAIQQWKPWQKSTGPKTAQGKAVVARNAFKGGLRPRMRVHSKAVRLALREAKSVLAMCDRLGIE